VTRSKALKLIDNCLVHIEYNAMLRSTAHLSGGYQSNEHFKYLLNLLPEAVLLAIYNQGSDIEWAGFSLAAYHLPAELVPKIPPTARGKYNRVRKQYRKALVKWYESHASS
jgi:hypothetical protein